MKKLLLIPFILIALIFGFYGGVLYQEKQQKKSIAVSTQTEIPAVDLMLDFGDGKIKTYNNIAIAAGTTVFSVIEKISKENGLDLSAKYYGSGMGAFFEGIDGYTNDYSSDKYWQFWVDNEYAKIGAGSYALRGGEVVEWKYVKEQVD
jgi:hypothetical protein